MRYDGVDNHVYVTTACKAVWDASNSANVKLLNVDGNDCGADSAPWTAQFWSVWEPIDAQHPKAQAIKEMMGTLQDGVLKAMPGATSIERKPESVQLRNGVPVHLAITTFLDPQYRDFLVVSYVDDSVPGRIYGTSFTLVIAAAGIAAKNPDPSRFKAELGRVISIA
ncbi:MAG TPA: hypothetical protein VMF32_09900, partial [Xanthobacteraceae bacterium]|nr:hypothetical protein [Xanthobacteraceae bacterium]